MWLHLPSGFFLSAQEGAGSTLESDLLFQMLEQSATWKTKSQPARSWLKTWKRAGWTTRLFGQTYDPLMRDRGAKSWIASLADTHASHFPMLGAGAELKTHGTSGPLSQLSLETPSHRGVSLKTSALICDSDSTKSPETFKTWATELRRVCLQRRKSAPRTNENDFLSWQTPAVFQGKYRRQVGQTERSEMLLPGQAENWSTPVASDDGKKVTSASLQPGLIGQCNEFAGHLDQKTIGRLSLNAYGRSRLNPRFVEWLMGWPEDWVDLTNCTSSVTE